MGGEYAEMELASFMSTSKGFMGEYVPRLSLNINSMAEIISYIHRITTLICRCFFKCCLLLKDFCLLQISK